MEYAASTLLGDSKSTEMFKKKKSDFKDVKSPEKEINKRIGGYGDTVKKAPEVPVYTTSSKETTKANRDDKDVRRSPGSPSYGLSPVVSKFESKVTIRDFEIIKSKG